MLGSGVLRPYPPNPPNSRCAYAAAVTQTLTTASQTTTRIVLFAQAEHAQRESRDRRHVLFAVDFVRDRTADDLRAQVRFPQERPVARVDRMEVPLAPAGEQHVRRRREDAAVGDVRHPIAPFQLAARGVESEHCAGCRRLCPVFDRAAPQTRKRWRARDRNVRTILTAAEVATFLILDRRPAEDRR